MKLIYFFDRLSFKQKIIFGLLLLSVIFTLGMGYMLYEFTKISQLSKNIIEKQRPIIEYSATAQESARSALSYLHNFLLDNKSLNMEDYVTTIDKLNNSLDTLLDYAKQPDFDISVRELERAKEISEEINMHAFEIKKINANFELNHPVINAAASALNPLALEYLGLLNSIIEEHKELNLPKNILVELANMRHSWTQLLSHLRVTLATRQGTEFINIGTYLKINKQQLDNLKRTKIDFGLEGLERLDEIRKEYTLQLDKMIADFDKKIWRQDANIMTTKVMPLFEELKIYLDNFSNIQQRNQKRADRLLSSQLNVAQYSYIALIIISMVMAFVISSFITLGLRKPLVTLVDATKEVAQGNLDTKIIVAGHDEITHLAQAFNEMISKLQLSQSALITARDVAEHANKVKSDFLTKMSHELRTPLNAILGFAQVLSLELQNDSANIDSKNVDNIIKSGWHLLDLVEELLDLSQIENDTIFIKKEKKDILYLVEDCIEIVRIMAVEQSMQINTNLNKDFTYYANVDPVRFKQVILNLLTNALKYNSENGMIDVKCDLVGEKIVRISIYDQGDGLTLEERTEVFDAFERLDADEKSIDGIGVGLNIAKNLIELMDGEIGVDSEKGKGSCFWVEMPIIETVERQNIKEENNIVAVHEKTTHDSRKVLYIEDDEFNLELVRDIFSVMRPEIILLEAVTAEIGLDILNNESVDLILMDLNLPGMSGQEAFDKLKVNERTMNIPVVAVSADAVQSSIESVKQQGFKKYVTKPLNIDDFLSVVDSFLDSAECNALSESEV